MAKKRRFDFTKKNKRSGKVENVGYLDLEQDEEQSRCSLYFYGDIVSATWESMWFEEDRCPQDIADFLNQLDGYEDIDIYFNSGGGDVFAGLAIYNQLKRYTGSMMEEWMILSMQEKRSRRLKHTKKMESFQGKG